MRYDSDDDSEYYLPLLRSSKAVIKDEGTTVRHSASGASDDFQALKKITETTY